MGRVVGILLFGAVGAAILIGLGVWQIQRLDWKRGVLAEISARIDGAAGPLPEPPDPARDRYQPVDLSGSLLPGEVHVLVSVKRKGAGYRVISPFVVDGRTVLVDRGFVPVDQKTAARTLGSVRVTGNLHWPDDRLSSTPANDVAGNIWFARDIPEMADALGTEPLLIIARDLSPADPSVSPIPVDTSGIPNDHLQYAITWFSLAAIWVLMTAAVLWRWRKT